MGHEYKFFGYSPSSLYFTSPWLFCNYLAVLLNPSPLWPLPCAPLPSGNHQNALCMHDSVSVLLVCLLCFFILFKYFIYLLLDRGEGREKKRERNIDVREKRPLVASHTPPTGDLAHNPGMCPDWDLNWWLFGSRAGAQSTEPHQQGQFAFWIQLLMDMYLLPFYCS